MNDRTFERARRSEDKLRREHDILAAASLLATERGVRAVTLTDIAAAVGMHKSSMLRYFETREEIFLRLAAEGWREWGSAARAALATSGGARNEQVAATLATTLVARPLFCDLLAQTPLNLERGVSFEAVRTFKIVAIAETDAVATTIAGASGLEPGLARDVVATATALAGAFWQMAAPGTALRRFYETDPDLSHAVVDVEPRLTGILTALLHGYARPSTSADGGLDLTFRDARSSSE